MPKRRSRDEFFLYIGIAMGAVLGVFGNIFASYVYDWVKEKYPEGLPWVAGLSLFFVVLLLLVLTCKIYQIGPTIKEEEQRS